MSRHERCLLSQTEQTSMRRNSHTTAQNSRHCAATDDGYLISPRKDIGGDELSHHSTEQHALCEQRRSLPSFANRRVIGGAELSHHSTEQQALSEQRRKLPYLATDQFSVVRNPHLPAHNNTLCVSRIQGYYISRTFQLSVVRIYHIIARNNRLCVTRDKGYLISPTSFRCGGTLTPQNGTTRIVCA